MTNFENHIPEIENTEKLKNFLENQMKNPENLETIEDFKNILEYTNLYFKNLGEAEKTKTATRLSLLNEGIIKNISNIPDTFFPLKNNLDQIT